MSQVYKHDFNINEPRVVTLTTENGGFQLTIVKQQSSLVTIQIGTD